MSFRLFTVNSFTFQLLIRPHPQILLSKQTPHADLNLVVPESSSVFLHHASHSASDFSSPFTRQDCFCSAGFSVAKSGILSATKRKRLKICLIN